MIQQKFQRKCRVERMKNMGIHQNSVHAQYRQGDKPHQHNRSKDAADPFSAVFLNHK